MFDKVATLLVGCVLGYALRWVEIDIARCVEALTNTLKDVRQAT